MPGPANHTRRSFDQRGASVNRELGFSVKNHEHLFNSVMEVMANTGARRDLAAMEKIELRGNRATIEQSGERHRPGATMHRRRWTESSRVGVRNAARQFRLCRLAHDLA